MMPVSEVRPYEKNPRKNQKAVKFVKASIEKFGFKQPIIVDSNRVVVCGHTRLLAAKSLGMAEVPCIFADDLTDAQELDIDKMKAADMKALLHKIYEQKLPTTVIDCNMPAKDGEHPTMKPVRLFGLQITNSSRGGGHRPRYFRRLRNDDNRVRAARKEGARHGTGPEILRRDHSQVGAAHWREGGEGRRGVA